MADGPLKAFWNKIEGNAYWWAVTLAATTMLTLFHQGSGDWFHSAPLIQVLGVFVAIWITVSAIGFWLASFFSRRRSQSSKLIVPDKYRQPTGSEMGKLAFSAAKGGAIVLLAFLWIFAQRQASASLFVAQEVTNAATGTIVFNHLPIAHTIRITPAKSGSLFSLREMLGTLDGRVLTLTNAGFLEELTNDVLHIEYVRKR